MKTLLTVLAGMLLLAAFPLPYGYYRLLRLVVCPAAAWVAYRAWKAQPRQDGYAVAFGLVAVLFNPFSLVFFGKGLWALIDIGVAYFFYTTASRDFEWIDPVPDQLSEDG